LDNFEADAAAYTGAYRHGNCPQSLDRSSLTANDFAYVLGRDFNFYDSSLFSFDYVDIDSVGQIYEILNDIGNEILHIPSGGLKVYISNLPLSSF
jgi:hypothetical protein